ncbi:unnamed protein product [Darwinula stevensoni]|uniref:DOMON domain-containing protein n=1 Tax=Darwinula stevensoni TaxID=69355 RepID=A0A7R9A8Y8_9CRUS|nr:unnamed protein product [Darwinula stevensoni]CAG0896875.1 unnamed protein product [Darwinula stevensoni]
MRMVSKEIRFALSLWLFIGGISLPSVNAWEREAILDPEGKVHLAWTPDLDAKVIEFEYTVQTLGWIGLGFSPTGGMRDSDVITAWIKDGQVFFADRHVPVDHELPRVDDVPNYNLISAVETGTATVIRFTREFDTCDLDQDYYITNDTVRVIFAYGDADPEGEDPYYHEGNRGTKSIYLLDPPLGEIPDDPSIKEWAAKTQTVIPAVNTAYWCSIRKTPVLDGTHHVIGYQPNVKPGNEKYVHHLLMYACNVPEEQEGMFDAWAEQDGVLCFGPDNPLEWRQCRSVLVAWAVGGEGDTYPENVGYVLPARGMYFMMEMHYDNPELVSGVQDDSGVTIYYTDVLRPLEMATMEVGSAVDPSQITPARQSLFYNIGHCSPSCTQATLPTEGIHVFAGILHSHLIGRQMRVRLFRNGQEMPWLQNDDNYDFNFQQMRVFREPITLYPGDHLVMGKFPLDSVTIGGFKTTEEMCLAFLQYYPAQNVAACLSIPDYDAIKNLFGITDLWFNPENYEYMVGDQTMVDYLNGFDWSGIDMDDYQHLLRYDPHWTTQPDTLRGARTLFVARRGAFSIPRRLRPAESRVWKRRNCLSIVVDQGVTERVAKMALKAIQFTLGIWFVFGGISLPSANGWEREETLDYDEKVHLSWTPDVRAGVIEFEYAVRTLGWVGLGFSSSGGMRDSDVVMGWVKDGKVFFTGDTTHVIYAYGDSDPAGDDPPYHGPVNRGSKRVFAGEIPADPSIKKWLVTSNMTIPEADTTYWCSIHKTPEVNVTHHVIGYEPYLDPESEDYVHHLILYACSIPKELEAKFDSWARQDGVLCYGPDHPREWMRCRLALVGWAVGGEGETYPKNVGYVLPAGGMFFMMEMHYNNPEKVTGIYDNSGITVFYTDVLRPLEMANLEIGAAVGPTQIIPARQNLFVNVGHCSSECTATAIPPGGIHIFSGFLHSHLIECYYNSSNRKSVTVGGFGTQEEMCLAFLHYYPAQKIASCLSLPSYEKLFALLRISNVRLEPKDGYEYMVSNNGKNQTLVDYLDELDWSHFDIEGLQRLLRYDPHNELCRANDDNLILPRNATTSYPDVVDPWMPPKRNCSN